MPIVQRTAKGDAADQFAHAFLSAQEVISIRERSGWVWPLFEITADKSYQPMQVVNAYIEPIVREALRKKRQASSEEKAVADSDDGTLLDHLVNVTDDPVVLKDEM